MLPQVALFKAEAPHLRRLVASSEAPGALGQQSNRELRRDMRTVGWLLHHAGTPSMLKTRCEAFRKGAERV